MRVDRYLTDQEAFLECPHLLQIRDFAESLFSLSFEIVRLSDGSYSLFSSFSLDGFPFLLFLARGVDCVSS